ncbi:hypothetical protein F2Q69_00013604 [Brassica cretica]|uniref:Uncharacterized protein n=1 Tax=Brassica cretica TaxID=69181 RepID=A0A8S9R3A8_BRACR|nr:hypothetical protein F2Q69_00013604 [Brassica cretica]
MFFRETSEKEEDIKRMFCEAREKMRKRVTLKKKSNPGQFTIPCTVEPSNELFTFVDCSQRNSGGIVRDLEVQIGNALVPVDFHVLDIKSAWIETHTATSIDSRHQKSTDTPHEESVDSSPDDWKNDYYNPTIAAYTRQNMDLEEYDADYEEERATEYKAILDDEDTLLHHSYWKRNAPSIDMISSPSIDTQPH